MWREMVESVAKSFENIFLMIDVNRLKPSCNRLKKKIESLDDFAAICVKQLFRPNFRWTAYHEIGIIN